MKPPIPLLVACASIALPFAAFGQSNDFDYCASLSKLFRIVVANGISDSPETVAVAQCAAGNTAAGNGAPAERNVRPQHKARPPASGITTPYPAAARTRRAARRFSGSK